MNPVLAIDTSSPVLSIALQKSPKKITEVSLKGFIRHAENLIPAIDTLLKKDKIKIGQIKTFLIGRGPGSFTGLRIGFATLKGFLAIEKKKCFGSLSLDLIAERAPLSSPWLAVCLDARRDMIYGRIYKKTDSGWQPKSKVITLSPEDWSQKLPKECLITGDALLRYQEPLKNLAAGKKLTFLNQKFWYPSSAALIRLHNRKDSKIVSLKDPKDFIPLYFRRSEAEERKRAYANAG